ncbi:protein of unknown function DUF820 (plasmid) [Thalassoporum mexicanum PCC 7367]|uniref:Uma2 family endonuclease n=1 Tax=Thalassoporum mexicanum TaxID=3457544 RepID=UPI00029F9B7C|nr:Uma2 family endonuclease [Pseudanabaena sp. PCC 7367]AFY72050.1 protein of unknown function DUF820 [Pseudanabaena sp. PCC 7367]
MISQAQGDAHKEIQSDLPTMSPAAYLTWEANQEFKYEYENGKIIAMTGGTIPHSQVATNFAALLIPHLRGKNCKVAVSDAKVMIKAGKYYYPDIVVTCDQRDRFARDFWQYPCLVAEVLSPAAEARDRGIKQQTYMLLDTLQTYILINPEQPRIEVYQRRDRTWEYSSTTIEASAADPLIHIFSLNLEFPLSLLYENIDFEDLADEDLKDAPDLTK